MTADETAVTVMAGCSSSSGSSGSDQSGFMMAAKDKQGASEVETSDGSESGSGSGSGSRRMWGSRVAKFLSSCSGNLGSSGQSLKAPSLRPCTLHVV